MAEQDIERLEIEVTTPGRAGFTLEAEEVILPGAAGVFSVLPNHTPLLSSLTSGVMTVYGEGGETRYFAVHGGYAEVRDGRVAVLTKALEESSAIDVERAREARARAEQRLQSRSADVDIARAEAALRRALARLDAHAEREY